tara:strand:- start:109 stop:2004 length:1896 start_codon:yes stop_codon:yes gene_type:complete
MNGQITNEEDALFLADQIKKGNLIGEKKEDAFKALELWSSSNNLDSENIEEVSFPGREQLDEAVTPGMWARILGAPVDVASMAMRPLGYNPDPEGVVASSEWWANKTGDKGSDSFERRLSDDLKRRGEKWEEIKEATSSGDQGYAEAVLQTVGSVGAGAAFDFFGQGLVSAGRGLSAITPDVIEDPITNAAADAGRAFVSTDLGQTGLQAAMQGIDKWTAFKEENPRAARNIESVVNIGLLAVPIKGKPKVKVAGVEVKPSPLNGGTWLTEIGHGGEKLIESGIKTATARRSAYIDDLILPKQTMPVLKNQVPRTQQTPILQSKIYTLSPTERAIAQEVKKVPTVSSKKTYLDNYDALNTAVASKNSTLMSELRANDVVISRRTVTEGLLPAIKTIRANPMIVGNAELTANKLVAEVSRLIAEMTGKGKKLTASGLLRVRKKLDAWVRKQKGDKAFDPSQENPLSFALAEIRGGLNATVAKVAPNVTVKKTLREQHLLLSAMNNIGPKAAEQSSNRLMAVWQRFANKLPMRSQANQSLALVVGVGGLGAAAMFAPAIQAAFGLGTAGYYGARAITSPQLRIAAGNILKGIDDLIKTTKDPQTLLVLRADRALIGSLLQPSNGTSTEEEQEP